MFLDKERRKMDEKLNIRRSENSKNWNWKQTKQVGKKALLF